MFISYLNTAQFRAHSFC